MMIVEIKKAGNRNYRPDCLTTKIFSVEECTRDYSAGGHEKEAADEELHPWHARCGHVYGLSADR